MKHGCIVNYVIFFGDDDIYYVLNYSTLHLQLYALFDYIIHT